MQPKLQTLTTLLNQHLEREFHSLTQAKSTLEQLHETLIRGSIAQLESLLQRSHEQAMEILATRQNREKICSEFSECFDIPVGSINLSVVISRLPVSLSQQISEYRDRLPPLAQEVEQLTHRCANLVTHCQRVIQKAFSEVTEGGTPVFRYGPGSRQEAARGTVLVTQG